MIRVAISVWSAILLGIALPWEAALAAGTERPGDVKAIAAFGEDLTRAFNERDEPLGSWLIDIPALALRVSTSFSDNPREQAAFARGMSNAGAKNILMSLFKVLDTSRATVKCMKTSKAAIGNGGRVLIRFDLNDRGVDYLEFVVEKDAAGRYRAVDWYQLSRGELMSVSLGAVTRLMSDPSPDVIRKLFGVTAVDRSALEAFKSIGALQRAGKYAEAVAALKKLPERLAETRLVLTILATNASLAGMEAEYKRTLAVVASKYGDDPSAAFLLLDHYFYENQMEKAVQALTSVERRVGVDGVTTLLKANAYLGAGDFGQTIAYAKESMRLEPGRADPYHTLAAGYIGLKNYPEAVTAYKTLASEFGFAFERKAFLEDARFAEFAKSAEFARWLPR
jgi:tetratricopeptide (TPR) repeat protein